MASHSGNGNGDTFSLLLLVEKDKMVTANFANRILWRHHLSFPLLCESPFHFFCRCYCRCRYCSNGCKGSKGRICHTLSKSERRRCSTELCKTEQTDFVFEIVRTGTSNGSEGLKRPQEKGIKTNVELDDEWKVEHSIAGGHPNKKSKPEIQMASEGLQDNVMKDSDNDGSDVDEYGRSVKQQNRRRANSDHQSPNNWPPVFNRRSATYDFDERSGMFYHAPTQFYFDPRTKLYYGIEESAYFRYCEEKDPPFELVEGSNDHVNNQEELVVSGNVTTSQTTDTNNNMIRINLKTPAQKRAERPGQGMNKPNATRNKKRTTSVRGKEELYLPLSGRPTAPNTTAPTSSLHSQNLLRWSSRSTRTILKTRDGKSVCMLCRRKFRSDEALVRHEELSKRHKMAISETGVQDKQDPTSNYRDRAKERRILHGLP